MFFLLGCSFCGSSVRKKGHFSVNLQVLGLFSPRPLSSNISFLLCCSSSSSSSSTYSLSSCSSFSSYVSSSSSSSSSSSLAFAFNLSFSLFPFFFLFLPSIISHVFFLPLLRVSCFLVFLTSFFPNRFLKQPLLEIHAGLKFWLFFVIFLSLLLVLLFLETPVLSTLGVETKRLFNNPLLS